MDTNRLQPASVRRPLIRRGAVELGAALGACVDRLTYRGALVRRADPRRRLRRHAAAAHPCQQQQRGRPAAEAESPRRRAGGDARHFAKTPPPSRRPRPRLSGALWRLQQVAQRTVRRAGSSQTVRVRLEQADFAAGTTAVSACPPASTPPCASSWGRRRPQLVLRALPGAVRRRQPGPLRHPRRECPGVWPVRGALRFVGRAAAPGRLGGRGGVRPPYTPS